MIDGKLLENLGWDGIVDALIANTQTEPGSRRCLNLSFDLTKEQVEKQWSLVTPIKELFQVGYRLPIGEIPDLSNLVKSVSLGQVLNAGDCRDIFQLLLSVKKVLAFATSYGDQCTTLALFSRRLDLLEHLRESLGNTVGEEGEVLDSASPELSRIRKNKKTLRKRIEDRLSVLLRDSEVEAYLQDDYFTVRNDRYVVPIRLDGRGRVAGSILDTSDSGQTLFIEPKEIGSLNEDLKELEISEKIEIIKIFKDLSDMARAEIESIRMNFQELVELDLLSAQSLLANKLNASRMRISDEPVIDLKGASHPLLLLEESDNSVVANDIHLGPQQLTLIISGPNAGGKTVILKMVGLIHLMAKAGLLIPCSSESQIYLFEDLHMEMGDSQSLENHLSTFSGHIKGLTPILDKANEKDLILLDELAIGTEPEAGAAIAQAVLEELASKKAHTVVTTHFDPLKALPSSDERFRNGSMGFEPESYKPTYKLLVDIPGQSHGLEVASQVGLPDRVVSRARTLRGQDAHALDVAAKELAKLKGNIEIERQNALRERLEAEREKSRWEEERKSLEKSKDSVRKRMYDKYQSQLEEIKAAFAKKEAEWKKLVKSLESSAGANPSAREEVLKAKSDSKEFVKQVEESVESLGTFDIEEKLPGRPAKSGELKKDIPVFVLPLKKKGVIAKTPDTDSETAEVQMGIVNLRVSVQDIRVLDAETNKPAPKPIKMNVESKKPKPAPFVLQTPTNTLDIRGLGVDDGIERLWRFLDKALLRGERAVIIVHGHGTDRLKHEVRDALETKCPYDISYRPGHQNEGGDGATVVELNG